MPLPEELAPFEKALEVLLAAIPSYIDDTNAIVPITPFHDRSSRQTTRSRLSGSLEESNLFLSRIDGAIDKLTTFRRLHNQRRASLRNALYVPLLGLPTEIVGTIFEHTVAGARQPWSTSYYRDVYRLAHICSRWREIALSWTPLFTYLDLYYINKHSLLDAWLEKSGQAPVDIFWTDNRNTDLIQLLSSRIRHLGFSSTYQNFQSYGSQSLDQLEVLFVYPSNDPVVDMSSWNITTLRQVALIDYPDRLSLLPSITSKIRFLSLSGSQSYIGFNELLRSCQRLEGLELTRISWAFKSEGLAWRQKPVKIEVSDSLKHLSVKGDGLLENFFYGWSFPNLETFYWEQLGRWNEVELFLRRSPHLHTMIFAIESLTFPRRPFMLLSSDIPATPFRPFSNLRILRLLGNAIGSAGLIHQECIQPSVESLHRHFQDHYPPSSSATHSSLDDHNSTSSHSTKLPIRLEIEDPKLLGENRAWYEERMDSVAQVFHPDRRPHPDWCLAVEVPAASLRATAS